MKRLWIFAGKALFWICWPLLRVYLSLGRRTRVLVICGEQVLLTNIWMSAGHWSLPGGGYHKGETAAQAAARELREETGLAVACDQLELFHQAVIYDNGLKIVYDFFVFQLGAPRPVKPQPIEINECRWVNRRELSNLSLGPDVQAALSSYGLVQ